MKFDKVCYKCQIPFQGARNSKYCPECGRYKPRQRKLMSSKWRVASGTLQNRDLVSYFLGFCSGDGSVLLSKKGTVHNVGWYSTDLQIVEDIGKAFGYQRPVFVARKPYDKFGPVWGNLFFSDNARFFVGRGLCHDKKQLDFGSMDADLWPFLRGLLDSDGTVALKNGRLNHVTFLGQKLLIESVVGAIGVTGIRSPVARVNRKLNRLPMWFASLGGRSGLELLRRMYEPPGPSLVRKHTRVQALLK